MHPEASPGRLGDAHTKSANLADPKMHMQAKPVDGQDHPNLVYAAHGLTAGQPAQSIDQAVVAPSQQGDREGTALPLRRYDMQVHLWLPILVTACPSMTLEACLAV